ncbi:putative NAD dependent epimerase/dehydratase [Melanomma pulvis-pyrius CBS 109.77]|uniref:Putative NAD dependent epimerase/dehydratase n=1 Tax=Melanomma pulvis-pyrius CBS 109.77 TaxID=1314802 RepID=A0A6A6XVT2_9PLEO|nr:putative NAD dependent epimerase/dehydratase [Melanomma pulvis-pyrius CBS 109.77]
MSSQTQQTIFIAGASGYIGSVLTTLAISRNYTVHALSRSTSSDAKLLALGATPIRGDLSTHDVLTREAAAADIVINLADALAGNYATMTMEERTAINNAAIDALIEGLKGSGKTFVVTSGSLMVAADPEGNETNEESQVGDVFKTGTEAHALATAKEKGVKACVVRLAPLVYGRGGSGVRLFMEMFNAAGGGFYVDEGKERVTTVHVDDAARLYLLVAQKGRAGECYNATFETDVTQRQVAEAVGKVIDIPIRSQSYLETEQKIGPFFARFLSCENRASNKKAKSELGWEIQAEMGILEEIEKGSYVQAAEEVKKGGA